MPSASPSGPGPDALEDAVIIAAGRGTRMRPSTRVVPKEFLPNFDRPLIHATIEEAIACGAKRIAVVTSDRSRPLLERYFAELDEEERGDPKMASLRALLDRVEVRWVEQPEARGTGNATLHARELVGERPFLLMLPDVVFPGEPPGKALAAAQARLGGSVISVSPVSREAFGRYGIVEGEPVEPGVIRLRAIAEKPGPEYPADSGSGINGRYLLQPGIFDAIEEIQRAGQTVKGEINLTDAMVLLAESEPFFTLDYAGPQIDSGHPVGYLMASVASALERTDVADQVRAELRGLLRE